MKDTVTRIPSLDEYAAIAEIIGEITERVDGGEQYIVEIVGGELILPRRVAWYIKEEAE